MGVGCMLDLRPNSVEPYYDFRTLLLLGFPFIIKGARNQAFWGMKVRPSKDKYDQALNVHQNVRCPGLACTV